MRKFRPALSVALLAALTAAQAADLRATVKDDQGKPVADAVVVAVPEAGAPLQARPAAEQIEQVDLEFVPRVKPVLVGAAVVFPNRDTVRHHVYSFSQAKRFELPLYVGTPARPVVFDTPGVVTIGCNIHDWMIAYVYVSESPHFAKTGSNGVALLPELAPGRYTVRVWHPQLAVGEETTRRAAQIAAGRSLDLEWLVPLKPEVRVRRAPSAGRPGRY
jgi:plastocyanin